MNPVEHDFGVDSEQQALPYAPPQKSTISTKGFSSKPPIRRHRNNGIRKEGRDELVKTIGVAPCCQVSGCENPVRPTGHGGWDRVCNDHRGVSQAAPKDA